MFAETEHVLSRLQVSLHLMEYTTLLLSLYDLFRNPMGRTGIKGRGVLNRYSPNHRCTAIITRLF